MAYDLDNMSLKELRELQTQVTRAISTFEDRKKKEALSELEETARKMGFTLAELTGMTGQKKRKAAPPKYANPANPSETWTGRGRRPRWVEETLAKGGSLESLAVS